MKISQPFDMPDAKQDKRRNRIHAAMQRTITFLVYQRYELLDLSGPYAAFNLANELYGAQYTVNVVSADGGLVPDRTGLVVETKKFATVEEYETVLAVGGPTAHLDEFGAEITAFLGEVAHRAERMGSVCTGAFLLAAAGILDGRRATTHWRYAGILQSRYPSIQVDADRIFIRDGNVWTAAGMTAGIDLALALIDDDFGSSTAKGVARDLVVYHQRLGGQSQFSVMLELTPKPGRVRDVLCYARDHLSDPLTVERLAEAACISPRQFSRLFLDATGTTPAKAVERLRLEAARPRIEDQYESLEKIARDVGFGTEERMRRSCVNIFGRTPQELRRAARERLHPKEGVALSLQSRDPISISE